MPHPPRIEPQPGQESVWDYPRPPRLEPALKRLRVIYNGVTIADAQQGWRVLETSHPPVYYIAPADIHLEYLKPTRRRSFCEFKGNASYWTMQVGDRVEPDVAWSYAAPTGDFQALRDHIAFYASRMDACYVGDEQVQAQPGDFYGGWITSDIVGPFKGTPGTMGW